MADERVLYEADEARLAEVLCTALQTFARALPGRATRRDSWQVREFWEFWEGLSPIRQRQLCKSERVYAASRSHFQSSLAPADIAAIFGQLDGTPSHFETGADSPVTEPPLTRAVTEGNLCLVRDYLVAGADPDQDDSRGTTALMYACYDRSDTKMASLLCVAGGKSSVGQLNNRGESAETLTKRYAGRSYQPQLLRILSIAGRLSHEQLLAFGAGYHPRLGECSVICDHLNSDVMDRVAVAMPHAWRRQSLALRAKVWQRFGGPGALDEGIWPWMRPISAPGYSEAMLAKLCGDMDKAELDSYVPEPEPMSAAEYDALPDFREDY